MKTAVLTGSFNPITNGHIYLLKQALCLFDKVYMVMLINPDKIYEKPIDQRLALMKKLTVDIEGVEIAAYDGYACDYCKSVGSDLMIRGIRNPRDLKYETELRRLNLDYGNIDTMFIISDEQHRKISSTDARLNGEW